MDLTLNSSQYGLKKILYSIIVLCCCSFLLSLKSSEGAELSLTSGQIMANGRIIELVWTIKPPPSQHGFPDWRPGYAAGARVTLSNGAVLEHIQTWSTPYDIATSFTGATDATALSDGNYYTQYLVRDAAGTPIACSQLEYFTVSGGVANANFSQLYGLNVATGYTYDIYLSAVNGAAGSPLYLYMPGQTTPTVRLTAANPSVSSPTYPPPGWTPTLKWISRWRIPAANLVQFGQAVSVSVDAGVLQDSYGNTSAAVAAQAFSSTTEGAFTNYSLVDSSGFSSDAILPDNTGTTVYVSSVLGNDSRTLVQAGNIATPLATIQHALDLAKAAHPNSWVAILLRRGDTFANGGTVQTNGRDFTHPLVIGSYWNSADGTDPAVIPGQPYGGRPVVGAINSSGGSGSQSSISHVVVRGIVAGQNWLLPGRNIFFEDMITQRASTGANVAAGNIPGFPPPVFLTNLTYHRCLFLDCYDDTGSHSAAFSVSRTINFVVSQCLVDRNGYTSSSLLTTDIFSHNSHGSVSTMPELWFETINRLGGQNGIQFRNGGCTAYCIFSRNAIQAFQTGFGGTAATKCVFEKARDFASVGGPYTALAGTTTWTRGSTIVTGIGTAFRSLTTGLVQNADAISPVGTLSPYPIASVESDTHLTLMAPFYGVSALGVAAQRVSIGIHQLGNNLDFNYGTPPASSEGAVYESSLVINTVSTSAGPHAITIENNAALPDILAIVRNVTVANAGIGLSLPRSLPPGAVQDLERLILPTAVTAVTQSYFGTPTFVNGSADMGTYWQSIGGTDDGSGLEQSFINHLRTRPWRTWEAPDDVAALVDYYMGQYTPTNLPTIGTGLWDYYGAQDYRVNFSSPPPTNQPPTVSITSPTSGSSFTAGSNITISATASDSDGTIAKVDFYQGTTLLGTSTVTPYSYTWLNPVGGSYSLTAKATDNSGAMTTSSPVSVTVTAANIPPTVSITSPTSGTTYTAPASISLSATASDPDGTVTKVDFYNGTTQVGTATPIGMGSVLVSSFWWNNVPAGSYSLTAKATDNSGAMTTSSPVTVTVTAADIPPSVNITSPTSGSSFTAGSLITITASASDTDGTVSKVDFYQGTTLLGTSTVTPYSYTWLNPVGGSYSLTAKAADNSGAVTTSSAVNITVTVPNQTLSNPGFESGNTSWTDFGFANAVAFNAHTGSFSMQVGTGQGGRSQTLSLAANTTYVLSGWGKVGAVGETGWIGVRLYNALSVETHNYWIAYADLTYAQKQISFTTDSDTVQGVVWVWKNSGIGAYFWADDLSLSSSTLVNQPPSVSITSPSSGSSFVAGNNITINATASDSDGTVAKVEFYQGTTLLGTSTVAPYSYTWVSVPAGGYSLTAKAADNGGGVATSSVVNIIVNPTSADTIAPTVSITSPANGSTISRKSALKITVSAADNIGVSRVEFYVNGVLLATDSSAPYSVVWIVPPAPGKTYRLQAKAYDAAGNIGSSLIVTVIDTK